MGAHKIRDSKKWPKKAAFMPLDDKKKKKNKGVKNWQDKDIWTGSSKLVKK